MLYLGLNVLATWRNTIVGTWDSELSSRFLRSSHFVLCTSQDLSDCLQASVKIPNES